MFRIVLSKYDQRINRHETTGNITYTYSSNRSPYLQMNKDLTLYSLPDTVALVFNSTMPIDYIQIDARNRYNTSSNFLKIVPEEGDIFQAGVDYKILLNLEKLGGIDHIGTYPITIKAIKFTLNKGGEVGDHTLALKSFYCHYSNVGEQPIRGDVNCDGEVTIADVNAIIGVILSNKFPVGDPDVNTDGEVNISDVNAVIAIILS